VNFKYGATVMKLNTAVMDVNAWGMLISHYEENKNLEYTHRCAFTFLKRNKHDSIPVTESLWK
jgi:hypothetical protein